MLSHFVLHLGNWRKTRIFINRGFEKFMSFSNKGITCHSIYNVCCKSKLAQDYENITYTAEKSTWYSD